MQRHQLILENRKPLQVVSEPSAEWFASLHVFPHAKDRSVARLVLVHHTLLWADGYEATHDDILSVAKHMIEETFVLNGVLQRIGNDWRLSELSQTDFASPKPTPYFPLDQALKTIATTPGWNETVEALGGQDPTAKPL